ncbi:hypothetical protein ACXJY6_06370 [Vibrio sp. RC27]
MDLYHMLLNDPVVYYSFIGLGVTVSIFAFLMFFFIKNTIKASKK